MDNNTYLENVSVFCLVTPGTHVEGQYSCSRKDNWPKIGATQMLGTWRGILIACSSMAYP